MKQATTNTAVTENLTLLKMLGGMFRVIEANPKDMQRFVRQLSEDQTRAMHRMTKQVQDFLTAYDEFIDPVLENTPEMVEKDTQTEH